MKIIYGLRKRRNTFAAISKLPNEIMAKIFVACQTLFKRVRLTRSTIILVCTAWKDIAMNTPQFWSLISFWEPRYIRQSLVLSKKTPLTVTCDISCLSSIGDVFDLVCDETYRFEELVLHGRRADASNLTSHIFRENPNPRAPLLRHLVITIDPSQTTGNNRSPLILTSFWGDLTALRSMMLRNVLPGSVVYLPSLTDLKIDVSKKGKYLSITWAAELLRNMPMLENATLGKISSKHPLELPHPPESPIPLPKLCRIQLNMKCLMESKLLDHLQIPDAAIVGMKFLASGDENEVEESISHLRRFFSSRFPEDASLEVRVDVDIGLDQIYYGVYNSGRQFTNLTITRFPSWLRWENNLLTSLPLSAIHHLRLEGDMGDDEALAWSNFLPHLTQLKKITSWKVGVLRLLAGPDPSSPNVTTADFSNLELETIDLNGDSNADDSHWITFISICQTRFELGRPINKVCIRGCTILKRRLRQLAWYTEVDCDDGKFSEDEVDEDDIREDELYEDDCLEDELGEDGSWKKKGKS
ncbi:hypothetical protein ONZ45_g6968 [Pleurotus djamor]|nr:hypothetical protein ONZ45_g6968 [Pleurotus djamor]